MLTTKTLLALAALGFGLTGCGGGSYQASGGARFNLDPAQEINDEDVQKAFAAAPQLRDQSRVAYYTFDQKKADDVEKMLTGLPAVSSTYRIPDLFVTGRHRFDEPNPWEREEVSIKKLRLLAARAHADVLIVVDYGYRGAGPNALVALNVLLFPALFLPFMSNETESYAQAYVVDVRNGYLYGEAGAEQKDGKDFVTIYGRTADQVFEDAWPELVQKLRAAVSETLKKGARSTEAAPASAEAPLPPHSSPKVPVAADKVTG